MKLKNGEFTFTHDEMRALCGEAALAVITIQSILGRTTDDTARRRCEMVLELTPTARYMVALQEAESAAKKANAA